ncbi:MAG: hypothetical protein NWE97_00415 [Candidatus Bathyarchaeota archaeon]|nr:hypothetical protein [Candidatus Bathyarchaeota archaeon]
MELKILSKKPVKFVTLLLTAMLIASASAAVYYSLNMTSTVSVFGTDVYFVEGTDNSTAGLAVAIGGNGTTIVLTGLRAYPNATFTYEDPIRVRNNGTQVDVRLRHISVSDPADDFVFINFTMQSLELDYTASGSNWNDPGTSTWLSMPGTDPDTEWSIKIETKATAGASTSSSVTIEMTVDVE